MSQRGPRSLPRLLASLLPLVTAGAPVRAAPAVAPDVPAVSLLVPPRPPRGPMRGALPPAALQVGIEEHLGRQLPEDLSFEDEDGRAVRLGDHLRHGRPVVIVLAYYRCPMLCDLVLRGLAHAVATIGWTPGRELDLLTVSIDPEDTPAAARLKQGHVLQALGHPESRAGWPFLVGGAESSRALADAIGFQYVYDPKSRQYAHAAGAVVVTPDGRVARYVYGIDFRPFDLRLALTEAGQGKVGGVVDRALLTCFRYDPASRRYGLYVVGVLKGGGLLVLLTVATGLVVLWRRDAALRREQVVGDQEKPADDEERR
ncbi:MAG TPA: SCO family protein [Polyangia bacterium]|nr:SCO family protein [Polyangia bacterium]